MFILYHIVLFQGLLGTKIMDNRDKKGKPKGGAAKLRTKKLKELVTSAQTCRKLTDLFTSKPSSSKSKPSSSSNNVVEPPESMEIVVEVIETENVIMDSESLNEEMTGQNLAVAASLSEEESAGRVPVENVQDSQLDEAIIPFNYFIPPDKSQLSLFFKYHPKQCMSDRVFARASYRKDGTIRKWLTYSEQQGALFCSVCLAFASTSDTSIHPFCRGMNDRKHVHLRVEEHEKSEMHRRSAEAYFLSSKKSNIENLLMENQMSLHRSQVRKRREVLERIIDIIKFIGKRGLSYRGDKFESAYSLEDMTVDHGNFLELVVLLSKYDVGLKEHLNECIDKSKKLHQTDGTKGRGSLLTFLSKTTINKIILAIAQLISQTVSREVQAAGMFSLQIDTTQDISCKDQCSIIVRYVSSESIFERLLAVVECESSTGKDMLTLVGSILKLHNIDITRCIGNSTDGAANMQGQYNGFTAWLSKESPGQVHVWCHAHILNLVLGDTTKAVIQSASLFSLMNDVAVFLRESYQRMNIWEQSKESGNRKRLSTIGETRWWSKDTALRKIFGSSTSVDSALYVNLILTLSTIQSDQHFKPDVRVKAKAYIESLCKYETILTAKIFLRIFEISTPLSKYLQTSGLDIIKSFQMISQSFSQLKIMQRDFAEVEKLANDFVSWANAQIDKEDIEFEVQTKLPEKRIRKKKVMPGEKSVDEPIADALSAYEVNVHNVIFDTVCESMDRRFLSNRELYHDFSCLDPKRFSEIRSNPLQSDNLNELSKLLIKFNETATGENLRVELNNFVLHWDTLKTSELENYKFFEIVDENDPVPLESQEDLQHILCETRSPCKNCAICCYKILNQFNLLTNAYSLLGLAYKFLLTLSLSQVACERSFSTLKIIKNRMRGTLSAENLNSFMLMAVEKDLLINLDCDDVIDKVAESSELLRKSLTNN